MFSSPSRPAAARLSPRSLRTASIAFSSPIPHISLAGLRQDLRTTTSKQSFTMAKRKRNSVQAAGTVASVASSSMRPTPQLQIPSSMTAPAPTRRTSSRRTGQPPPADVDTNPDTNVNVEDGPAAWCASPDAQEPTENSEVDEVDKVTGKQGRNAAAPATPRSKVETAPSESSLPDLSSVGEPERTSTTSVKSTPAPKKAATKKDGAADRGDPEADGDDEAADPEELKEALSRPPPVNSSYLPLPWKGRLGYACLNTYLRFANPPVFSSRTCRIASILEHRHPLKDASQPEHATKNRPDKEQPADIARGQAYVEALGLANANDISKMLRWNDRYGIKFLRLSSEMFPFASHAVYGYKLAPFASEALAQAGRIAADLGHRLTTHPGQFTQLGSPRAEVITASIRDLEYHCELLDLLKLPPQQDRDAVMILHMGGVFGDKMATIQRFRENYAKLPQGIKNRLVLENDDVCYTVHDLLPVCEELNIPLVLDYHHHNILFDSDKIREGTLDIMSLYDRIKATWDRKHITQKMHYSEPTPAAITARQRRKHNPRVATLPPCAPDMDLMIEAKDKEQACFELMRTFKLPGYETIADILPHVRNDENKPWKPPTKKKTPNKKKGQDLEEEMVEEKPETQPPAIIPDDEIGMGGPDGRVYWPPTMEGWLRPKKREVKPRDPAKAMSTAAKAAQRRAEKAEWQAKREASAEAFEIRTEASAPENSEAPKLEIKTTKSVYDKTKRLKAEPTYAPKSAKARKGAKAVPTPSTSENDDLKDEEGDLHMPDLIDEKEVTQLSKRARPVLVSRRQSGRGAKKTAIKYTESDIDVD